MFEHCLAPDLDGDGTGCDNMTCIILSLKDKTFPAAQSKTATTIKSSKGTDSNKDSVASTAAAAASETPSTDAETTNQNGKLNLN